MHVELARLSAVLYLCMEDIANSWSKECYPRIQSQHGRHWPSASPQSSTRAYRVPKKGKRNCFDAFNCVGDMKERFVLLHRRNANHEAHREPHIRVDRSFLVPLCIKRFPKRRITSRRFPEGAFFLTSG